MPPLPDLLPVTDTEIQQQPPYAVILHNDDINTMGFVISVLQKVFGYPINQCVMLMFEAHAQGRAIVWTGLLEVAELKADQIISCGPDPTMKNALPLRVTVEALPG